MFFPFSGVTGKHRERKARLSPVSLLHTHNNVFLYQSVIACEMLWRPNIVFIVIDLGSIGWRGSHRHLSACFSSLTPTYPPRSSLAPRWDEMKMAFCLLNAHVVWLFHTSVLKALCQICNWHHDSRWLLMCC